MRTETTTVAETAVRGRDEQPETSKTPLEISKVAPVAGWLDIEREPLMRLQPVVTATIEAAPVAAEEATVEPTARAALAPSPEGCPAVIVEVFGANAPAACAVAWCESRWSAWAIGDHGASLGLFQVQPRWHQWRVPGEDLADPEVNTRAAYLISGGGRDWSAWTCKP